MKNVPWSLYLLIGSLDILFRFSSFLFYFIFFLFDLDPVFFILTLWYYRHGHSPLPSSFSTGKLSTSFTSDLFSTVFIFKFVKAKR